MGAALGLASKWWAVQGTENEPKEAAMKMSDFCVCVFELSYTKENTNTHI